MQNQQTDYDLIIVGGGMVGASLAAALLPQAKALDLSIAIIEAVPLPSMKAAEFQPSYDARATALAYGSRLIYEQMGVWDALSKGVAPIEQIHVSDKGHFGATRLNASEERVPALGYVIENHWLGQVLLRHIQAHEAADHVEFLCPATVEQVTPYAQQMSLTLKHESSEQQLSAQLVVLADGGRSTLREQLGIAYQETAYGQHAIVANVSPDRDHHGVAYERFTDTGPMALLPLQPQAGIARCGLVWTVSDAQLDDILALDDDAFMAAVQERFGYRAGRFIKVGERASYPLKLTLADEQVRQGLVVLGNAAHALHPIAGQGYNLALRGVVDLADHVIATRKAQQSLGGLSGLQQFYTARMADQQRTIGLSDKTMKLFSTANPALALGRDMGLQLLDICRPAKTLFARGAMGLDIKAPKLK